MPCVELAETLGMPLLIEPEPDLLIERFDQYLEFVDRIDSPLVGLNFDVGHAYCVGEDPQDWVARDGPAHAHYHFEDIAATRVHEHLVPGRGAIDFAATLAAIKATGYDGWLTVELYPYLDDPDGAARDAGIFDRVCSLIHSAKPQAEGSRVLNNWRAYFELLRFPAVFTAVADVMMGYLVTQGNLRPAPVFALLVVASSALYLAGMVFNDAFDAEVDALERPDRPIPSRRISRTAAFRLGWLLFVIGIAAAWTIEFLAEDRGPLVLAVALATFIYLYDWEVKRHSIGPLNMGVCRTLNVLLGMSMVGIVDGKMTMPWTTSEILLAAGVGVYIVGVTLFARTEASISNRRQLAGGMGLIATGLALIADAPRLVPVVPLQLDLPKWLLLWALLLAVIVRRCLAAWQEPTPKRVQEAVRLCIRSLIVIDAAIVLGFCGPPWGCAVLALLAPMLILERWIDTT